MILISLKGIQRMPLDLIDEISFTADKFFLAFQFKQNLDEYLIEAK